VTKSFKSIGEFVEYLERLPLTAEVTVSHGLHEATELVWEEARHAIGEYQDSAGPFKGWDNLSDATLNGWDAANGVHYPGKIELGFSPPDNPLLRTGELRDAIEFSVSHNEGVVGVPDRDVGNGTEEDPDRNVGDVAIEHEFGTRYMPARSFLGRSLYVKAKEVVGIIGHAVLLGLSGKPFEPFSRPPPKDDVPF